jgi:peptidyl-prolyl cis-trans isomerase C
MRSSPLAYVLPALFASQLLSAGAMPKEVACRGDVCVSLADVTSRFEGFPPAVRQQLLDSPDQMEQLLDDMLLRRQLVGMAGDMELESEEVVRLRLRAARERILADEALERAINKERPNFDLLAREQYLLNPSEHQVNAHRVVQHILVGFEKRSPEEALAFAEELRKQALAGSDFEGLVREHSDDPSRAENSGKFEVSPTSLLVPEFLKAAQQLEKINDISAPVRTEFGYHLIKYLSEEPGRKLSIEEAAPRIAARLETEWLSARRESILAGLRRVGTEYDKEGFEALRNQYSR